MWVYWVRIQHEDILGEGQTAQDMTATHFTIKDLPKGWKDVDTSCISILLFSFSDLFDILKRRK
jgi:hypothetical protein